MTIERAIEILDPEHREHYESIEPVNEACRMGMEALKEKLRNGGSDFVKVVRCKDCMYFHTPPLCDAYCGMGAVGRMELDFCSWGRKMDGDKID